METIIKKAIEGGYKPFANEDSKNTDPSEVLPIVNDIILDPLFWQALGKSCGWGIEPSGSIWQGQEQWVLHGEKFMRINLTEGWDKAVNYLSEITK